MRHTERWKLAAKLGYRVGREVRRVSRLDRIRRALKKLWDWVKR